MEAINNEDGAHTFRKNVVNNYVASEPIIPQSKFHSVRTLNLKKKIKYLSLWYCSANIRTKEVKSLYECLNISTVVHETGIRRRRGALFTLSRFVIADTLQAQSIWLFLSLLLCPRIPFVLPHIRICVCCVGTLTIIIIIIIKLTTTAAIIIIRQLGTKNVFLLIS
jgi:hypothetical protein